MAGQDRLVRVIDSHTEGEPTRVVIAGGPALASGSMRERLAELRDRHDDLRRSLILEPRGYDALVGALLCPPVDPDNDSGVIFFNNTGYLGMCGHGAIGVAVTLAWLGRQTGEVIRLETPVGVVSLRRGSGNAVTVDNVPSRLARRDVRLEVEGYGAVTGDVAWGGNWFFLADWSPVPLTLRHVDELTRACRRIKAALVAAGITGDDGGEIDHIELTALGGAGADSRNFVLCPGDAWDRSPCGTGTSARLACLAARGQLQAGVDWVQESISGGRFMARYRQGDNGAILPSITGRAYITGETSIVRQEDDPLRDGLLMT